MSLTRTGIPYLDFCHNPCGFGCSAWCDGCWAKSLAPRVGTNIGCDLCKTFTPHLHPERLGDIGKRKAPAVIGVQFTGELFDRLRTDEDVDAVLAACERGPQHEFVFLTQQAMRMYHRLYGRDTADNWYLGVTARDQSEVDDRVDTLVSIRGKRWASLEPLRENVLLEEWLPGLDGVIVGCDNRRDVAFDNDWARNVLGQCRDAKVPCYIKQIRSPDGRLLTNPDTFPADLRVRELPWTLRTKRP